MSTGLEHHTDSHYYRAQNDAELASKVIIEVRHNGNTGRCPDGEGSRDDTESGTGGIAIMFVPQIDSLECVEDAAIVPSGHFDTEGSGDEHEVEFEEVGLLVPWCFVLFEETADLGGSGDLACVVVLCRHLGQFLALEAVKELLGLKWVKSLDEIQHRTMELAKIYIPLSLSERTAGPQSITSGLGWSKSDRDGEQTGLDWPLPRIVVS